jgi:hypothetical protein
MRSVVAGLRPVQAGLIACLSAALGCGAAGPVAELTVADRAEAQALDRTPWPSDLWRGDDGRVRPPALTGTPLVAALAADLADEDGFGVTTGAFFPIAGALDSTTLAGAAHLLDLDGDGEIPVEAHLRAGDRPARVFVRPARGEVLREQRRYAFVLTRSARGADGALRPSSDLAAILAGGGPARAAAIYAPLLARLDASGPARDAIAAATVFTTHSITPALRAARAHVRAGAPGAIEVQHVWAATPTADDDGSLDALLGAPAQQRVGLDNPGGIAHAHVAFIVQGTFTTPDYLEDTTERTPLGGTPSRLGVFGDTDGTATPRGTAHVPFSLAIPVGVAPAGMPITLFQYGLDGDASSVMGVAESYAAHGRATMTLDLPFHGGRDPSAHDSAHTFGGGAGPDGWAEVTDLVSLSFFGVTDAEARGYAPADPRVIRSAFEQAVADLCAEVWLIESGDWSPIGAREPRLAGLHFATDRLAYSGISFGSIIGGIVSAIEPDLGASVLHVAGGGLLTPLLLDSAVYGPVFTSIVDDALGGTASLQTVDPPESDFHYQLIAALLERGDPLAYAPYVLRAPAERAKHVLQLSAHLDESVPNSANLALARALGLQPVDLGGGASPDLAAWPGAAARPGPYAGGPDGVTAALLQFEPATHGMLYYQHENRHFDLSMGPPYSPLSPAQHVDNPIERVHAIAGVFLDGFYAGSSPTVADAP